MTPRAARIAALFPLLFAVPLLDACGSNGSGDDSSIDSGTGSDTSVSADSSSAKDGATSKDSTTSDVTATCTTCPTGYACGTANGIPVCRSKTTQIPMFTHVFVIMMENTSLSTLETAITGGTAPNLKTWQGAYATGADYHGVTHPSLPNYISLTSGGPQGIGCDCLAKPGSGSCFPVLDVCLSCSCNQSVTNFADQLEAAQPAKTWMDFGEDMGTPCNLTDSGNYAQRHNPFLYYDDIQSNATRCNAHVVDFSNFSPATAADFNFIAPNLIDDMHNPDPTNSTNIPDGDKWLGQKVPTILSSSAYTSGGLLVIVWDEDDGSGGIGGTTDDPIGIWVMSPFAKSGGFSSSVKANHYSLLATFEDGLGVGRIGNAATASPLADYFPAN